MSFLAITQVLFSAALITLILMHSGRDTGFGGMGFTPASQGGTHIVERNLTRLTVVIATLFALNSVALSRPWSQKCGRIRCARWWRNW